MARVKEDVPYIFIHPAWRGAWCWDRVLEIMRSWGREAYALDCPGHGTRIDEIETATLADYPKAIKIPDKISHIIWYMAFILKDGESILDACPPEYSIGIEDIKDNRYPLPPLGQVRERWMQDMKAEEQTADLKRWQPQPLRSFSDKPDLKRFYSDPRVQQIPRSFINGVKDVTFDWEYRKAWDPRLSGNIRDFTYAEVPGSHCCFNCHPEELVQAVIELAEYEHRAELYARERQNRKLLYTS